MRFTAISCSRQAITLSSDSPFFRASFALCSMWVTVCGIKRNLKKSTIVGLGGIAASMPSSSGRPLGVKPPKRTPVPRRSLGAGAAGWWSRLIIVSSRASARSSEDSAPAFEPGPAAKVLRSAFISLSSRTLATLSPAGAGVNEQLLRLDLRQLYVALPALGVAPQERLHLSGCARERVERRTREKLLGVLGRRDRVEPAGELVDDRLGRARRNDDAPPRRHVTAPVAELRERRHLRQRDRALRRGGREDAQPRP